MRQRAKVSAKDWVMLFTKPASPRTVATPSTWRIWNSKSSTRSITSRSTQGESSSSAAFASAMICRLSTPIEK